MISGERHRRKTTGEANYWLSIGIGPPKSARREQDRKPYKAYSPHGLTLARICAYEGAARAGPRPAWVKSRGPRPPLSIVHHCACTLFSATSGSSHVHPLLRSVGGMRQRAHARRWFSRVYMLGEIPTAGRRAARALACALTRQRNRQTDQ